MQQLVATLTLFLTTALLTIPAAAQNAPPRFVDPTPSCGGQLPYFAGIPLEFRVRVTDADRGDRVTLSQVGAPVGMVFSPPLPILGNPVETRATWMPTTIVGSIPITFTASDGLASATCRITLVPGAECFLLFGAGRRDLLFTPDGDRLFVSIEVVIPVTLSQIPRFPIPADVALLGTRIYSQVLMHNPVAFPDDPTQVSNGLEIVLGIGATAFGDHTGIEHWLGQLPLLGGVLDPRFHIKGM